MTEWVLTFSRVATGYGSKKILEDISLDVKKGKSSHWQGQMAAVNPHC